ncbi:hypothetical protein Gorai_004567 [Gossypium raimondii]|uniref:Uncharacterized protein n=1 Tax=Gossypium raimondii TaxID=29730 RepID=A0A7J8QIJ5_GOSRA|nr:hypothetical protein [Gossypium raimondii]
METSSSLTSLEDKATKKVHMHCSGAGEDDHLMVVDDDGNRIGFEKFTTSGVSFKDMLLGASRGMGKSMHELYNNDLQLFHGDVTKGIEDDLPSIRFSTRKSILMSIGETIGQVIKLDDNTGNAHRGRFVCIAIFLDLNKSLVFKIKVDGHIQHVEHDQVAEQGNHDTSVLVENGKESDTFGPWMVVNCQNNRIGQKLVFGREERKDKDAKGSHFNILHDFRDGNQINIGDYNPAD